LLGAPVAATVLALAAPARANGRMPAGHQLVVSPVDPNTLVMETTFGLLFSHDLGATFGWVCETPIGYGDGGQQDPSIGITTKFVLAGEREGLSLSPDQGCTWTSPIADPVVDLVVRPDNPHVALALTSRFTGVGDAGENLYTTRVLVSKDDGATWNQLGVAIDPSVQVETIEVARSDANRIYLGGASRQANGDGGFDRVAIVLSSTNAGASYDASTIALVPPYETTQGSAFVSGVDPSNPQRVYVRIGDYVVDRLLVSDDGAKTFNTAFQGRGPLLGFTMSADGSKVFVGGPSDGVHLASSSADAGSALRFAARSDARVSCLAWAAGTVYACMGEPTNAYLQQLGASTDDGLSFPPRFLFACQSGPLTCAGGGIATSCTPGVPLLQASLGICPDGGVDAAPASDASGPMDASEPDAANPESDATADGGTRPPTGGGHTGCGCSAGDTAGAAGMSLVIVAGAALLRRRYRSAGRH
jgi:MYXO-CTERM domain-containing protein